MAVLEEVMRMTAAAESKDDRSTSWQIRVQLATTILDLVLIDTEVLLLAQTTNLIWSACDLLVACR